MVDFKGFKTKEIKTPELSVTLELKFQNCSLTEEEAHDKISFWTNNPHTKSLSYVITDLLRITGASTWENGRIEVKAGEESQ